MSSSPPTSGKILALATLAQLADGRELRGRLGELGLRIDRDATSRIEDMSLEDVEGFLIKKAMARFDGNVSQAAKALGLSRSALYRRLQRYGL